MEMVYSFDLSVDWKRGVMDGESGDEGDDELV